MSRTSSLLLPLPILLSLTGCGAFEWPEAPPSEVEPAATPPLALSVDTSPVAVGAEKTYSLRFAAAGGPGLIRVASVTVEDDEPAAEVAGDVAVAEDGSATFLLRGLREGVVHLALRAGDGRSSATGEAVLPVVVADGAGVRDCRGADPRDGLLLGSETDCEFTALYSGEWSGDVIPEAQGGLSVEPAEAERVIIRATSEGRAALRIPGAGDAAALAVDVVGMDEVRRMMLVDAGTGAALDGGGAAEPIVIAHLAPGATLAVRTQAITADGRKLTGAFDGAFAAGQPDVLDASDDGHVIHLQARSAGVGWIGGAVGRFWQFVVTVG